MSDRNPETQNRGEVSKMEASESEQQILKAVRKISYGSVEIVVHDGRVVQIETREKVRLDK